MSSGLVKLPSRLIFCTGSDPEHPASELEMNTPHSKGWVSEKFCDYPQEVVIQFLPNNAQPFVKLREVQVIVHQNKIPVRIELQAFMPGQYEAMQNELPLSKLRFEPLGYMNFDSNEKSNYQTREMKSAYLPEHSRADTVMLLKLLIRGCHHNKFNLFNQVSLLALNCLGHTYPLNPGIGGIPALQLGSTGRLEEELHFDLSTLDKLTQLEEAKKQAVASQDYEHALRIKEAITKLKSIGVRLTEMESRKKQALDRYDFGAAQRVKEEIDAVRKTVINSRLEFEPTQQKAARAAATQRTGSGVVKGMPMIPITMDMIMPPKQDRYGMPPQKDADRMMGQEELNRHYGREDVQRPLDQRTISQISQNNQASNNQRQSFNALDDYLLRNSQNQGPQKQIKQQQQQQFQRNHDELVIPTHQNGNRKQPPEYDDQGSGGIVANGKIPDSLSEEEMKFAGPLIPVFGEDLLKMLHAQDWHLREQALTQIEEEITRGKTSTKLASQEPSDIFVASFGIISKASSDKIAQVALASMLLAIKICKQIYPKMSIKGNFDLNRYIDKTCLGLMDKIGDNNARLREKTEEAALTMAGHPSVGASTIFGSILSKSNVKKQAANSVKHIFGKLHLLKKALETYKTKATSWESCIQFALTYIQHQASEIRNQAFGVILELYSQLGKKIMSELGNLRPSQSEILNKAFADIDAGNIQQAFASIGLDYQSQRSQPLGSVRGSQRSMDQEASPVRQSQVKRQTSQGAACQFCLKRSPAFAAEDAMDLHLFKECELLNSCPYCDQVLEVRTLQEHFLQECEKRGQLRQCPRCKLVVHEDVFEKHTKDASCPMNPNNSPLCPLCAIDITTFAKDLQEAWHKHLAISKCPNNTRKGMN